MLFEAPDFELVDSAKVNFILRAYEGTDGEGPGGCGNVILRDEISRSGKFGKTE